MLSHSIIGFIIIASLVPTMYAARPVNDFCSGAIPVDITSSQVYSGNTTEAVNSTSEELTSVPYKLWYSFTPSFNTTVNVTLCNTESNNNNIYIASFVLLEVLLN